jgi:hypothetical protein
VHRDVVDILVASAVEEKSNKSGAGSLRASTWFDVNRLEIGAATRFEVDARNSFDECQPSVANVVVALTDQCGHVGGVVGAPPLFEMIAVRLKGRSALTLFLATPLIALSCEGVEIARALAPG